MRCLGALLLLLGAAHAGPFFKLRFGPEHRTGPEAGPELLEEPLPEQEEPGAVFALQLPKIDLSELFRPLRVFAGVNVNHPPAIGVREEPNCDQQKFQLTDDEFDIVMDCQKLVGDDEVGLKECILTKLPKTNVELRDFLDREEFGVAGLSSSFHLTLLNGEFTQKRSVQFRLCPRDEVNAIDGGELVPVVQEVVPVVEEMVPVEALNPDRVDGPEPELGVPQRPLFQFPVLQLPDFGQIFSQAFAPVFGPRPEAAEEEDTGLGLFGSHLNPFSVRPPPAVAGPQHGFFASLFPAIAQGPPQQASPEGIDTTDCTSKEFDVSRFVFNVANRCQYANDYRKCLKLDLADDESAGELLAFVLDPGYSVVASSFSSFQTTFDLEALSSGQGLRDLERKNRISLKRCANIVSEETTTEEQAASGPDSMTEGAKSVPAGSKEIFETVPETVSGEVLEAVPETVPGEVLETVPETVPGEVLVTVPEAVPEEIPVVLGEAPSEPAPGTEVTDVAPEAAPEVAEAAPEVAEAAPEVTGVAPEVADAAPEVADAATEAPAETAVDAGKASAEAEKAAVVTEAPAELENTPVEPTDTPVEAEKAAVEAEKAAASVQSPTEQKKPVQANESTAVPSYDVTEP